MRTRFAPSPTGLLHLGHAYAAHFAHQLATTNNGEFLLRFEDIDTTRTRPEFYTATEQDLHWLGLDWQSPVLRQTDRFPAYAEALEKLKSLGLIYPCFCTRAEIQSIANAPQGPEGPLYTGTCRRLSAEETSLKFSQEKPHCWRLDAAQAASHVGRLSFTDLIHGSIEVNPHLLGDVILARKDIATSYHLAVVVDDAWQGISHVTRGEDLLASTHIHCVLQNLLELPRPIYAHHRLITDEQGRRLAKRDLARSLKSLRDSGCHPAEIIASWTDELP